jgi:hypothetical protein
MVRILKSFFYFYKPNSTAPCWRCLILTKMKHSLHRNLFVFSLLTLFSALLHAQGGSKGYRVNSNGTLEIADSLLPGYLLQYGSAGIFRKAYSIAPENYAAVEHLISIPVLVGEGISREQSLAWFTRSLKFNLSGQDPEGKYTSGNGAGNIALPSWVRKFVGQKYERIEDLYNEQCVAGNILVVDKEVFMPLMISGGMYALEQDLQNEMADFHIALVTWAAAYPWFFYELPNLTLRLALAKRDQETVQLFALNRFGLNNDVVAYLRSEKMLPIPN